MLLLLVQFLNRPYHAEHANLLEPLVAIAAGAVGGLLLIPIIRVSRRHVLLGLRGWRVRRHARRGELGAEIRARAMMGELCPHGWSAQITLLDGVSHDQDDPPPPGRVALDWVELRDDTRRPAVVRRVWAPTVAQALQAMVVDRQTDAALEQIEMQATADGADWPDP